MGFISLKDKTISAKLVYYGVGMGGKTTSLQAVHGIMCPRDEVQLVSINTEDDATLLFDFLPIDLGQIAGFKIRIQGYTVPGQPKYKRMRRLVLQGADAVVLVVDSQASRLEENVQSRDSMCENLRSNGLDPETLPIVLQYNKRDLSDVLAESELDAALKWRDGLQSFPSIAHEGHGVFETFVHAAGQIIETKAERFNLGRGKVDGTEVADGVRSRLWELHDEAKDRGEVTERPSVSVTVPSEAPSTDLEAPGDGEVLFSDEELEQALFEPADTEPAAVDADVHESGQLLEDVIQSNVELAEQFGELDRYKSQLERKNKELVQVAQNAVHDLNKPVAVLRMMLASLRKGMFGDVTDKMGDALDNGLAAVQLMERLISDLLDSSRLDYDGVQLDFREVDLELVVGDVLRALRFEISESDARVLVEPLPVVCADEWALHKVVMNLVGNALQYGHPDRSTTIRISAEEEGDRDVLVIADNGMGVPADDLSRLFRRFERGSNTRGISGSGLGLHIVREVVLGHGGEVWVESVEGEGATFRVALPHEPVLAPHSAVADVQV